MTRLAAVCRRSHTTAATSAQGIWPNARLPTSTYHAAPFPAGAPTPRCFGAYKPRCRHMAPTDARIKGLGREIADEYAFLKDRYSNEPAYQHGAVAANIIKRDKQPRLT